MSADNLRVYAVPDQDSVDHSRNTEMLPTRGRDEDVLRRSNLWCLSTHFHTREDSGDGSLVRFWEQLYGTSEGEGYLLNVMSGIRPPNPPGKSGVNTNRLDQSTISNKYFQWPQQADEAAEWASQQSEEGREVYQCAHLLTEPRRKKANAVSPTALFADGDWAEIPEWLPPPNIVIESSTGRKQYGWSLADSLPPDEFERMNKTLTYAIGADKSKWPLTSLLRVPGTRNHKYEGAPVVQLQELEDNVHDPRELERVLSPENLRDVLSSEVFEEVFPPKSEENQKESEEGIEPPVALDNYGMKVWQGENVKSTEEGEVDTSASLLLVGRVLYDAGATEKTIVEALKERDVTLGWRKYADRTDDKEYYEIFRELERNGRNNRDHQGSDEHEHGHYGGRPILGKRVLLGEVSKNGIEPPKELVEDVLLEGGVHQIYSQGGTGKTFVALYVTKVLIDQGKSVFYLDQENGQRIMAERLIEGFGADPDKVDEFLHYYQDPEVGVSSATQEAYLEAIDEVGPALVIFDSFIDFLAYAGLEDNSPTDVTKWFVWYVHPLRKRGIAVLILDHTNKTNESDSRGAGQKKNEVSVQWYLIKKEGFTRSTVGQLILKKKKDRQSYLPEEVHFKVGGTEEGFVFEKTSIKGKTKDNLSTYQRIVLNVLVEEFGSKGATYTEWQKACRKKDVSEDTFKKCRKVLYEREKLVDMKEGSRYVPK